MIAQLLGFKIATILNEFKITEYNSNPKDIVPFSLILLISYLIREDIIVVEDIWLYFVN